MTTTTKINNVTINVTNGIATYNVPANMSGKRFAKWKQANAETIERLISESLAQVNEVAATYEAIKTDRNSAVIEGVKIVRNKGGKFTFYLPQGMSGDALLEWKQRNAEVIALFKSL
jgi:hypothetical protein